MGGNLDNFRNILFFVRYCLMMVPMMILSDGGAVADGDGDLLGDIFPFAEVQ